MKKHFLSLLLSLYLVALNSTRVLADASGPVPPAQGPNGGILKKMSENFIELKIFKSGNVSLFLLDKNRNPRPLFGATGRVYLKYPNCKVSWFPLAAYNEGETENDEYVLPRALSKNELGFELLVTRFWHEGSVFSTLFENQDANVQSSCEVSDLVVSPPGQVPGAVEKFVMESQDRSLHRKRNPLYALSPLLPGIASYRVGQKVSGVAIGAVGLSGIALTGLGANRGDQSLVLGGVLLWGGSVLFDVLGASKQRANMERQSENGLLTFKF